MKRVLKWLGIILGSIVLLIVLTVGTVMALSVRKIGRDFSVTPQAPAVPTDGVSLARGEHLANVIAKCSACHAADFGGATMEEDPAFGSYYAANLTSGKGGKTGNYTPVDWTRSIRHGVAPDGRALVFMPAIEYNHMTDEDLGALIAYLQSRPPVDREVPKNKPGPVARALFVMGGFPLVPAHFIDHAKPATPSIVPGRTKEYGEYLAHVGGCAGCHGPALDGEKGAPGAPGITPAHLSGWTEADFFRALREGKRPDGRQLTTAMPWAFTARMTDLEIGATWLYLQSL